MPQIHFNGKTYNDLAEMPANERQMYEQLMSAMRDEDGNGVPDVLEGDVVSNIIEIAKKTGGNSEGVAALERMSPEMRARISKGIAKLQEFGLLSGMPDLAQTSQASSSGRCGNPPLAAARPIAVRNPGGYRSALVSRSGCCCYHRNLCGWSSGFYHCTWRLLSITMDLCAQAYPF